MKSTAFCLAIILACILYYDHQHPFSRPRLPEGHEYAAKGVYFLRTGRTLNLPAGPVQWTQGQQVFADTLDKTPLPDGIIMVTDGTHSTQVPANMLSEDVQEGEALRDAVTEAQHRAERVASEKARQEQLRAMEAMRVKPTPTPKFGHTALDQPPSDVSYRTIAPSSSPYPQGPYR